MLYVSTNGYTRDVEGLASMIYLCAPWIWDYPISRPGWKDNTAGKDQRAEALGWNLANAAYAAEVVRTGGSLGRHDNDQRERIEAGEPVMLDWEYTLTTPEVNSLARQLRVMRAVYPEIRLVAFGMKGQSFPNPGRSIAYSMPWVTEKLPGMVYAPDMEQQFRELQPLHDLMDWIPVTAYCSTPETWAWMVFPQQYAEMARRLNPGKRILAIASPYWQDAPGKPQMTVDELTATLRMLRMWADDVAIWAQSWGTVKDVVMKTLPLLGAA